MEEVDGWEVMVHFFVVLLHFLSIKMFFFYIMKTAENRTKLKVKKKKTKQKQKQNGSDHVQKLTNQAEKENTDWKIMMNLSSGVCKAHLTESMFSGAQTFQIHQLSLFFKKLKSSDGVKRKAVAHTSSSADEQRLNFSQTGSGSHRSPEVRLLQLLSVG